MKKYISLFTVFLVNAVLSAQIGINTELPQKLFHVDALKNTSGSTNVSDDVVVDAAGNVGLGVLSPTAKLHIAGNGVSPAMRIVDGTQRDTRILRSDANGGTSWVDQPQSGGAVYNLTGSVVNYPKNVASLVKAVQVTEGGNYLVVIRWWGTTTNVQGTNETSAYFYLDEGTDGSTSRGTNKDAIEYYVCTLANQPFSFTTSLFANIKSGSWLKVFMLPSIGATTTFNWVTGGSSTTDPNLNPSIVFFKV